MFPKYKPCFEVLALSACHRDQLSQHVHCEGWRLQSTTIQKRGRHKDECLPHHLFPKKKKQFVSMRCCPNEQVMIKPFFFLRSFESVAPMSVCPGTQLPHVVVDQLIDKCLITSRSSLYRGDWCYPQLGSDDARNWEAIAQSKLSIRCDYRPKRKESFAHGCKSNICLLARTLVWSILRRVDYRIIIRLS